MHIEIQEPKVYDRKVQDGDGEGWIGCLTTETVKGTALALEGVDNI